MTDNANTRLRLLSLLTGTVATLAACGGGDSSGGSTPPPPPPSTNVAATYASLMQEPHSWTLTGTTQGTTVTAQVALTPGDDVTYNGTTYHTTALSSTISAGSQVLASNVETLWLDETTLEQVFVTETDDGSCGVVVDSTAIPTSAQLGDSGSYSDANLFASCTLPSQAITQVGTSTNTWSFESTGGLDFFCLNGSDTESDGTSKESDCVEVADTSGALGTHARIVSEDAAGDTLTFAN